MKQIIYELIGTRVRPVELASLLKNLLGVKRDFYKIGDNYWYLDPVSNFGGKMLKYNYYEPDTAALILETLKEGDTFIDLGGNEGYFSILASKKVGKSGKVYCIEPQYRLHLVILKNINKNGCLNIHLLPFLVSDKKDTVSMTLYPSLNTGASTLVKVNRGKFWKKQTLNSTTLDELFFKSDMKLIKLIKVDIEGYEFFALKGGQKLLEKKLVQSLFVEFHPTQLKSLGHSTEEIIGYLNSYGYFYNNGLYRLKSDV